MRSVVQRVNFATLKIDGEVYSQINKGLVALVGVAPDDDIKDAEYIAKKIAKMRIFEVDDKMNADVFQAGGEIMIVSQFTLYGDMRGGNRPSFIASAGGEMANNMYEKVVELVRATGINVVTGVFGADMKINLENDGPVTIMMDSKRGF